MDKMIVRDELEVEHLAGDHFTIMVVEGHIDINQAASAMKEQCGSNFNPPEHTFMRYSDAPDGEPHTDNWREICNKNAKGAEPVTASVTAW